MCDPVSITMAAVTTAATAFQAVNSNSQMAAAEKQRKEDLATQDKQLADLQKQANQSPVEQAAPDANIAQNQAISRLRYGLASTIKTSPKGLAAPSQNAPQPLAMAQAPIAATGSKTTLGS